MENDPSPQPQSSDQREATTTDDNEKDNPISEMQTLADSVETVRIDTQAINLESQDVDRSSNQHQHLVLHENLRDLDDLVERIESLVEPSPDDIVINEVVPWQVKSAVLQAMFTISTERHMGAAFMQYVDYARALIRNDLLPYRLQESLKMLISDLRKLVYIEITRETQQKSKYTEKDVISTRIAVYNDIVNNCLPLYEKVQTKSKSEDNLYQRTFETIGVELFSNTSLKKGQVMQSIEELQSAASLISSRLQPGIVNYKYWLVHYVQNHKERILENTASLISDITKLARGLQSTFEEREKKEIEKAIREVIFRALDFHDVIMLAGRDFQNRSFWRLKQSLTEKSGDRRPQCSGTQTEQKTLKTHLRTSSPPRSLIGRYTHLGALAGNFLGTAAGGLVGTAVGGVVGAAVGGFAGTLVGATGLIADRPDTSGVVADHLRGKLSKEEEVQTQLRPAVSSGSFKPVECVATPFSDPVYLRAGGGSSGGGGSGGGGGGDDGGDDGGGGGGGDGGGDGGGEGSRTPDRDRYADYSRRYLDACRSLTDAINDLCRITSQINGIQNDCREMLRNLGVHVMMLKSGLPSSALSYPECVGELLKLRESIVLLNNDQPMVRVEFFRTLRYIISAVCKTLDLATQCIYLLNLQECDVEAAKVGIVDVQHLKKTLAAAQFTCYKMLQFSPEEARQEAVVLKEQTEALLAALADAGRRSLNMREQIAGAAANVHRSAEALDTLERGTRESISNTIMQLLRNIKKVGVLAEDPELVPIAANISQEARERRRDVVNGARNMCEKAEILVNEAMTQENLGDDTRPLTWGSGRDVAREFEDLVVTVRKNGRSAGFLEDIETDIERRA